MADDAHGAGDGDGLQPSPAYPAGQPTLPENGRNPAGDQPPGVIVVGDPNGSPPATATSQPSAKESLLEVFSGDEEDIALISAYSGAIAYLNASAKPDVGDVCSETEKILGWIFWSLAICLYCLRHFIIYREQYAKNAPKWARMVRCAIFCAVLLIINEQPLTCLVPMKNLKTVRYVQAALWTALAMVASQILVKHYQQNHPTTPTAGDDDGDGDSESGGDGGSDGDGGRDGDGPAAPLITSGS